METNDNVQNSRLTEEERKGLVSQWKQSWKSRKKFSEENGLKYYTFIGWCVKYDKQPVRKKKKEFIELNIKPGSDLFAELKITDKCSFVF